MKNFIFILLLFLTSCYKLYKYEFEDDKKINVICFLKADDTIRVNVSYTFNINSDALDTNNFIEDAEVYLYENNLLREKLSYKKNSWSSGWYCSKNFFPDNDNKYTLKVYVKGYDTLYAETYIPACVLIDSMFVTETTMLIDSSPTLSVPDTSFKFDINIKFKDTENYQNYYSIKNTNTEFISYDPVIETVNNENYFLSSINEMDYKKLLFSDTLFADNTYTFKLQEILRLNFNEYETQEFTLISLSKDAYLYYKTCYLQHKSLTNPLTEPVIIYSNIKNGTGIFAGLATDTDSIKLFIN